MASITKSAFILAALLLPLSAMAADAQDQNQLIDQAVSLTFEIYETHGMPGLKQNSQDCYQYVNDKVNEKFLCIYLDTAAQQIDRAIADPLNAPRNPYFDNKQFLDRAGIVLHRSGMSMRDANAFLNQIYQQVEASLNRAINDADR